jgi:hypothetical protein
MMNIKKQKASFFTFSLLFFSFFSSTTTQAFSDIAGDVYFSEVAGHLRDVGIMRGNHDGNFYPEQLITRAEALTIALRAGGITISKDPVTNISFTDIDPNQWYANSIQRAVETGILRTEKTEFRPEQAISKAEFLAWLFRATRVDFKPFINHHHIALDIPKDSWFEPYFSYAKKYQIAHLPPDQFYRPEKSLSRREVALMTYRQLRIFHGNIETKLLVELDAKIQQFLTLIKEQKTDEAQFHLHEILQINDQLTRKRNNNDAHAARAISRAMTYLTESLRNFNYGNDLVAIEKILLAQKQVKKAQGKSESLEQFAQDLAFVIEETLYNFTHQNRYTAGGSSLSKP